MQRAWVQFLVGELISCMFHSQQNKQTHIKQKQCCNKSNKDFKYGRHSKKDPQNTLVT